MPKTYEFSSEDIGDVFNGKLIRTDTLDIVAFISSRKRWQVLTFYIELSEIATSLDTFRTR